MGVIRYHEGIRVEGLLFVVFFQSYENLFQQMLHSVRINR
jgi:hypothetical protein